MHELSIAQEILGIVYQYVPDPKENSVKSVRIRIGKLSNILPDSLTFCFEAITTDTPLKGAKLEIIHIPVAITCSNCNTTSEIEPPVFTCPLCGSNQIKITGGTDMRVDSIELNDEIEEKT
ncbi:hydrogenase/urease nickel incorporation protein HypA [bacterium BMS3Abin03]|nr:hydrogenase/urease nickel incorporation protein HypA [bacterium BMS3Abin03]